MRKLFMAALFIACTAPFTFAQTSGDDYNKYDFYVGYSHDRVDTGFNDPNQNFISNREGFNGVEGFVKGNVSRYVGLVGDYSFHRKSFNDSFTIGTSTTTFNVDTDLHTLMGGAEFKDNNKETKVKPFARVLAGFQHARAHSSVSGIPDFSDSETGFSGVIGGGLDFRVSPRVDFRAIQFDYNPTRLGGEMQHNFRIGVGIIFR
ncbi:MAG: hypothetical protein QOH51_3489 [Acidobacteriota bacterium]|nr:hypothetical protein [Acidobacteriota bacterium]